MQVGSDGTLPRCDSQSHCSRVTAGRRERKTSCVQQLELAYGFGFWSIMTAWLLTQEVTMVWTDRLVPTKEGNSIDDVEKRTDWIESAV